MWPCQRRNMRLDGARAESPALTSKASRMNTTSCVAGVNGCCPPACPHVTWRAGARSRDARARWSRVPEPSGEDEAMNALR
jgi:hypothetical protein